MRVAGRGVVGGGTGAPGRGGVRWRRQWRTVHPMQTRRARRSTAEVTRETTLECGQKRGGVVEGRGGETVRSQAAARHVSARDLADGGHVQGRTEVHTEKKTKKTRHTKNTLRRRPVRVHWPRAHDTSLTPPAARRRRTASGSPPLTPPAARVPRSHRPLCPSPPPVPV